MPAELPTRNSVKSTPDTTQLVKPERKSTDRRHDKKLKPTDASAPSPTSRITPNSTPDASPTAETRPHFTDDTVILQHGSEANAEIFTVRKGLLDNLTPFWRGESEQRIILPKANATVFDMFIDFLNGPRDPLHYLPSHYSPEPWRSHAVDAWFFADLLNSVKFERFALSHFIVACALLDSTVFLRIENDADAKSSLCRFSKHWVAWNHSFASDGKSEYAHLAAAALASLVTRDTNDPRIYDVDHWFSPCGDDINSSCIHDPIVRENAVKELFAARRPVPEEGLQWEHENQPGRDENTPSPALASNEKKSTAPTASILPPPPPYTPSKPTKPLQISTAAQALLSSTSNLPPPPKPIAPRRPPPKPRPKPKASILSKSSYASLRKPTLTPTAGTEPIVPVPVPASSVINRTPSTILASPPPRPPRPPRLRNSKSYLALNQAQPPVINRRPEPDKTSLRPSASILASPSRQRNFDVASTQPAEPNINTTPLKQLSAMARLLLAAEMTPPPRTPRRLDGSLQRTNPRVFMPNQK